MMHSKTADRAALVVDDDPDVCQFIADVAEGLGLQVDTVSDHQITGATTRPRRNSQDDMERALAEHELFLESVRVISAAGQGRAVRE